MISGAVGRTAGRVLIDGSPVRFRNPNDAGAMGIATVHHNLALVGAYATSRQICSSGGNRQPA
jgi:ABC-type sugar transport system ATPase subunit